MMSNYIPPDYEAYEVAIDTVRRATGTDGLIDRVFDIIPDSPELEATLEALVQINGALGYTFDGNKIEVRRSNTFELGAIAGMLVALEIHDKQFPTSRIFATTRPQKLSPDASFFSDTQLNHDEEIRAIADDPQAVRSLIVATQRSIYDAGLKGLHCMGSEAHAKVRSWSYDSGVAVPKDFQTGFGFSIMGALNAQTFVELSVEALLGSDSEYDQL